MPEVSSCGDHNDDPNPSNLEGTWIMKNFDLNCDFTVTFRSGTAWMYWRDEDFMFTCDYTATDDKIFFRDDENGETWSCQYTIEKDILTVYGNMWGEEDDCQLFVFTRK